MHNRGHTHNAHKCRVFADVVCVLILPIAEYVVCTGCAGPRPAYYTYTAAKILKSRITVHMSDKKFRVQCHPNVLFVCSELLLCTHTRLNAASDLCTSVYFKGAQCTYRPGLGANRHQGQCLGMHQPRISSGRAGGGCLPLAAPWKSRHARVRKGWARPLPV